MLLLNEIAKDQMVSGLGYASLSTFAGASRQRSGLDPRVKPEDDEGTEGLGKTQTLAIGRGGHTNASSFSGKRRSRATRESMPERR